AALTFTGASFYGITKSGIYRRRREQQTPSSTISRPEMTWEEKIKQDEENAAKKGYKINYREIHDTSVAATEQE
ncbi:hypothetical protein BGW38_004862, partial [Lunasporangiospora selenospora]